MLVLKGRRHRKTNICALLSEGNGCGCTNAVWFAGAGDDGSLAFQVLLGHVFGL